MHTFQPFPITTLEFNPFQLIGQQGFVATAEADGHINTTTVTWGGMGILWGKNVGFICLPDSKYTKELIDASDTFSMTFFDPDQKKYRTSMKYLNAVSGRTEDKIAAAGLTVNRTMKIPFIDEGNFILLLHKLATIPITPDVIDNVNIVTTFYPDQNYHTMFVAEITDVLAR